MLRIYFRNLAFCIAAAAAVMVLKLVLEGIVTMVTILPGYLENNVEVATAIHRMLTLALLAGFITCLKPLAVGPATAKFLQATLGIGLLCIANGILSAVMVHFTNIRQFLAFAIAVWSTAGSFVMGILFISLSVVQLIRGALNKKQL